MAVTDMCPLRGAVVRVPPARAAKVPLKATVLKTIEGKQKSRGKPRVRSRETRPCLTRWAQASRSDREGAERRWVEMTGCVRWSRWHAPRGSTTGQRATLA